MKNLGVLNNYFISIFANNIDDQFDIFKEIFVEIYGTVNENIIICLRKLFCLLADSLHMFDIQKPNAYIWA